MPCVFMWLLPVRSHAIHHGVVLQEQALPHLEGRMSIPLRQPGYRVEVLDKSMRVWPHPHQEWESWGRCAATLNIFGYFYVAHRPQLGGASRRKQKRSVDELDTSIVAQRFIVVKSHTSENPFSNASVPSTDLLLLLPEGVHNSSPYRTVSFSHKF